MPEQKNPIIKKALVSVSDKTSLKEFCSELSKLDIEIISTGGTLKFLVENNINASDISSYTEFPEIMDGRVKTLHPRVHGGILARREMDKEIMDQCGITPIDLVVVNLYPFAETISKPDVKFNEAIENIDIGGPSMLRSAAKNNKYVSVVSDPNDYSVVIEEIEKNGGYLSQDTRLSLATKAFEHTASYDSTIAKYLSSIVEKDFPENIFGQFKKKEEMRYGENPHQKAAFYTNNTNHIMGVGSAEQLQGKQLSYNNIADADAALECVRNFEIPTCVIVKHANPCGVASDDELTRAYEKAFQCDSTSAFGGIIAFNRKLDEKTAKKIIDNQFVEVIIAPGISKSAKSVLSTKENTRVLELKEIQEAKKDLKYVSTSDGLLVQEIDISTINEGDLEIVSARKPTEEEIRDCLFVWRVAKFVKSNAIVFGRNNQTIGIGAGQMSRIDSTKIASSKATEMGFQTKGCSLASDAFFPFRDGIDQAASIGISSIIQPGGSIKDDEVIEEANNLGLVMAFTGIRHFLH